jgi:hypothetical protein
MNKKQKTEKCRNLLFKYSVNQPITNDEEIAFLFSIFQNHPDWEIKEGVGIQSISIAKNKLGRCFQLNRINGTYTDISFHKCITNKSKISEIKKACRSSILGEIISFKNNNVVFGKTRCPITNDILFRENTHIDHYDLTFDEMFNLWIVKQDFDFIFSKVNPSKDNCTATYFIDKQIVNDFIRFHNQNSKLRAVSIKANLSILKKRLTD